MSGLHVPDRVFVLKKLVEKFSLLLHFYFTLAAARTLSSTMSGGRALIQHLPPLGLFLSCKKESKFEEFMI